MIVIIFEICLPYTGFLIKNYVFTVENLGKEEVKMTPFLYLVTAIIIFYKVFIFKYSFYFVLLMCSYCSHNIMLKLIHSPLYYRTFAKFMIVLKCHFK